MSKKVLVIENNLVEAARVSQLLKAKGYETNQVVGIDEAFINLQQNRPDVIVLNIDLPEKLGLHLCGELKSDPNFRTVPLIVLTDANRLQTMIEIYRLGADYYLVKDSQHEQALMNVMENWYQKNLPTNAESRPVGWKRLVANLSFDNRWGTEPGTQLMAGLRAQSSSGSYQLVYSVDNGRIEVDLQVSATGKEGATLLGQVMGSQATEQWVGLVPIGNGKFMEAKADESQTFRFQNVAKGEYHLIIHNPLEIIEIEDLAV